MKRNGAMSMQLALPMPEDVIPDRLAGVLKFVDYHGARGATVAEVREYLLPHHGSASAALSVLHEQGRLVRLAERRERCSVYVTPDAVDGRPTLTRRHYAAPAPEPVPTGSVEKAFAAGTLAGRRDVQRFAAELREAVLREDRTVKAHMKGCYRTHPACALQAVMRFAAEQAQMIQVEER